MCYCLTFSTGKIDISFQAYKPDPHKTDISVKIIVKYPHQPIYWFIRSNAS